MSITTVFVDRESAYPNRYLMTPVNGTASYVVLERADEPVTPGTALNAETFNGLISTINGMDTEARAYTTERTTKRYASANGSAESLSLSKGVITQLTLDTWKVNSDDLFAFSGGGIVMPEAGNVLVCASVYFNTPGTTGRGPEVVGPYVKRKRKSDGVVDELSGQVSYATVMTTASLSPFIVAVEAGDVLFLCARNSTTDATCQPNGGATALTVIYL